MNTYAYSFNGENYVGDFDTRERALNQALEASCRLPELPATVFVAEKVFVEAFTSGHASELIRNMTSRARGAENGWGSGYLRGVTLRQKNELDLAIGATISKWLEKNKLMPAAFSLRAISEHAVPLRARLSARDGFDEVRDIGASEIPADLLHG